MYLRTIARRNKDGSTVRYYQLAHNVRNERGHAQAQVLYSFGREEELDRDALARLVRSITRVLEPADALQAGAPNELEFLSSRSYGGGYVVDALWGGLGVSDAIHDALRSRRYPKAIERVIFAMVANRALEPMSKLACTSWVTKHVWLPSVAEFSDDDAYRAMDALLDCEDDISERVFFSVANLLNLELDLIFFDTTSTWFEIDDEDSSSDGHVGFRRFGNSKDSRDDRPQVVIGMAVTKEGIPIRVWAFPGNASDQVLIKTVKDDLRAWKIHRVVWVLDRGFASEDNRAYLQRAGGHYIMGEKLRAGGDNLDALARPGRYKKVADNLEVKEVWVGAGESRRRFVVCRNLEEARRDAATRARHLRRIDTELAAIQRKRTQDDRRDAEGALLAHRTLGRYLHRRKGHLEIDRAKLRAEEKVDGKFLLSASDDSLSAEDIALGYKSLMEVERGWRYFKHVLDVRPVHHRKEDRIRAHVLLCWLGLLLIRVAELQVGDTWRNIRDELRRLHVGFFSGPAGRVTQRTEITAGQKAIIKALGLQEPPRFLGMSPAERA
jgi:hypothetical protein